MMPDVNSLPSRTQAMAVPAPPTSSRPRRISISNGDYFAGPPSPHSPALSSLQAAATINAGLHRSTSNMSPARQGLERRRSSLMNNLYINDPTMPAPGEMQQSGGSASGSPRFGRRSMSYSTADPHHQRAPSLGELHQELEQEQEAQVNRLLHMIRIQQDQLVHAQRQQNAPEHPSPTSTEHSHFATPASTTGTPATNHTEASSPRGSVAGLPPHTHGYFMRPGSLSRQSSAARTNSRGNSPALRPVSGSLGPLTEDFLLGTARDECTFYQAETHTVTRENQMLKHRIRELEKQIADLGTASGGSTHGHSPTPQSPLVTSPPATFTSESAPTVSAGTSAETDGAVTVEG